MNAEDMPKVLDAIRESELPVSEVVKFIKHGPEMEENLNRACRMCDYHGNCKQVVCLLRDCLSKLNREGK